MAADHDRLQLVLELRCMLTGVSAALCRGGPMLALYLACQISAIYMFVDRCGIGGHRLQSMVT